MSRRRRIHETMDQYTHEELCEEFPLLGLVESASWAVDRFEREHPTASRVAVALLLAVLILAWGLLGGIEMRGQM